MKELSFVCLFVFVLSVTPAFPQTKITDFGIFTDEDIRLTECSFDKAADAVVIFDQGISDYNEGHNLITERRIRFKILRESGIENGDIHIRFYDEDNFESISKIDAIIGNLDQNNQIKLTKLDQKTIYTRRLNQFYSEMVFAMPDVKVGSIIEYRYESRKRHYGGLRNWVFQKRIPVLLSRYELTILPNLEFTYSIHKNKQFPIEIKQDKAAGKIIFTMNNVPGLRDEVYMASTQDYLQRVDFQVSGINYITTDGYMTSSEKYKLNSTWEELARSFSDYKDFGLQLNKKLSLLTDSLLSTYTDPFIKMEFIHSYVRKNFQWNKVYSIYTDESIKTIAERKNGNTAELNLLLINLLRQADIKAYPLLVSERWHGKMDTSVSFHDQFDKVVALAIIDNKNYVLDATDLVTPSNRIPELLLNTTGFLVDRKNFRFVHLMDETNRKLYRIELLGDITGSGQLKGNASVNYGDYARFGKREEYNNNKLKYMEHFLKPGLKIDSFQVNGLENDSVLLDHSFQFEMNLGKSGSYYLLNYNLFTGFEKNPFTTDYRFTDIDFGVKSKYFLHGVFNVPENLTMEELPKNTMMRTPDNGIRILRQLDKKDNSIEINIQIEINTVTYSGEDYPVVKDFFSKMVDMLNEPILLKAK